MYGISQEGARQLEEKRKERDRRAAAEMKKEAEKQAKSLLERARAFASKNGCTVAEAIAILK